MIRCCLSGNPEEDSAAYRLRFETSNLHEFLPPCGTVTQFTVETVLESGYSDSSPGIYATARACCMIFQQENGMSLQGYAEGWDALKELIFKIISAAGCQPSFPFEPSTSASVIVLQWSEAMLRINRVK
jgi:hypothetical protein